MPTPTKGLLLINLGTPEAPQTAEVRSYLREFLGDPRVIDLSPVGRWALLNLVILPTRPAKSAEAYRKVWTERGSPLLWHSQDLTEKVAGLLGASWQVELAMRYGQPDLAGALHRFDSAGIDRIVVLPLYPQYSEAAWASSMERVWELASAQAALPRFTTIAPFYDDPGFLDAFAEVARESIAKADPEFVLFSYHGLPERQVKRTDATGRHCLESKTCCDRIDTANRNCYRAQCYATTRGILERIGFSAEATSTTFQSRLGRTPWIKPYTDEAVVDLAKKGVRRLAVLSPAFVADCLETLEEIAMRESESFRSAGGETLTLVPSLNARDSWAAAIVDMVRKNVGAENMLAPEVSLSYTESTA